MRGLIAFILLAFGLALSPACAPKKTQAPAPGGSFDYVTTGEPTVNLITGKTTEVTDPQTQNKVQTAYTISGSRDIYEELAAELGSETDQFLAMSIKDVRVVPLNEQLKVVRERPSHIEVQVDLTHMYPGAPERLVFKHKLEKNGDKYEALRVRQENFADFTNPYVADIQCYDSHCSLVVLRLRRHAKLSDGSPGEMLGQVGVLYSLSYPEIEVQKPIDVERLTNAQLLELERLAKETIAIKSSVVVVNGPSFSRVAIPLVADGKDPLTTTVNFMEIETDNLDTGDVAPEVKRVTFNDPQTSQRASAQLVGNDAETGSLIFDITLKEKTEPPAPSPAEPAPPTEAEPPAPPAEPAPEAPAEPEIPQTPAPSEPSAPAKPLESVRITLRNRAAPTQGPQAPQRQPAPPKEAPRAAVEIGKGLFPTSTHNRTGLEQASRFAGYAQHDRVTARVNYYLKREPGRLRSLFTYAPNVSGPIGQILESFELTPEFAYIMDLESDYLRSGKYNTLQITQEPISRRNPNPSAFGPWQITNATVVDIRNYSKLPFNFHFIRNKKWNPDALEDDRGYTLQATYMAGFRLASFCHEYKNDPAICVLGYHGGPGVPQIAVSRINNQPNRINRFPVTFAEIAQFKMAPKSYIDYVFNFLALREIGQNPEKYGFDKIQPASTDKYKVRLFRPGGPLPEGLQI